MTKKRKPSIIIDSNRFSDFSNRDNRDAKPIHKAILRQRLYLAYGLDDKSQRELNNHIKMKKKVARLTSLGVALKVGKLKIEEQYNNLISTDLYSDDKHIICLARAEISARLLYSHDQNLHKDFKNNDFIKPKGKIYQSVRNISLLEEYVRT